MEVPTGHAMGAQPTEHLGVPWGVTQDPWMAGGGASPFGMRHLWRQDKCPQTRRGAQSFSSLRSFAKPLLELQKFGFSVNGYEEWESEVPQTPSSLICSTAGFWTLLSLSKSSPQLLWSSNIKSGNNSNFAVLQAVGKDIAKLDFTLLC